MQRAFTCFAIDNQLLAVDPASAPQLDAAFRDFVPVNQPDNLGGPTHPPAPESFRTDRPWSDYILGGYGLHGCFGAYRTVLPAILKPFVARPGLRRAAGEATRAKGSKSSA